MVSFKDLRIWQNAHKMMLEIHVFVKSLPREEYFNLRMQIQRSSSSVADNIAEGYSAYYYNEKIKSMYIARKEAGETQNHIESLFGKRYLSRLRADEWVDQYERIISGINGYVNYIRNKRDYRSKSKNDRYFKTPFSQSHFSRSPDSHFQISGSPDFPSQIPRSPDPQSGENHD